MWLRLTAQVNAAEQKPVMVNMDNIVFISDAASVPTMMMGVDGQAYPVVETKDQIYKLLTGKKA